MSDSGERVDRSLLYYSIVTKAAMLLAIALPVWLLWPEPSVRHAPGVLVPAEPVQESLKIPKTWTMNNFKITALAAYSIEAEVLSKARYRHGNESDLCPIDFALGWGLMSDQALIDKLSISQSNRWYSYEWRGDPPASPDAISSHSANTHLVPADDAVRTKLFSVKRGEIVTLKGYLISVNSSDGWTWVSSLSRYDTGNGSCELMWVESVAIRE